VSSAPCESSLDEDRLVEVVPLVRRVVGSRIRDPHLVDDLVQETLARLMAARSRVESDTLAPYAATIARNLVASHFQHLDLARRKAPLLAEEESAAPPVDDLIHQEERRLMRLALERMPDSERDMLLAHEVLGQDTRSLAARRDSTPGAVAAALSRSRAKLRVEYLLVREDLEPTGDRCRPVLRALSAGDRRRQRELDAGAHLLHCDVCSRISFELLERGSSPPGNEVRIPVESDADVVTARKQGREVAARLGFSPTDATLLATALSEIARNIVKFAVRGEVLVHEVSEGDRQGVAIVVRDVGPGIPDVDRAMQDGFSTYDGLGLGLPGARRLMDQFEVVSEQGRGTTVTMTKWRGSGTVPGTTRGRADRERQR
jgi:RNA polymerase sigma factor (sigma-70 family)